MNITIAQAKAGVEQIRARASDAEKAHSEEDALRDSILEAIANGSPESQALAKIALLTNDIDFPRWCA